MKAYEINISKVFVTLIISSFLYAGIGIIGGVNYGGITYNESISEHMSITNGVGFNANLEKSIGPMLVGAGYLQQNYTENFDSEDYDNSNFKNTVSASYVVGYAIYPYEIWKFRFWGGVQLGKCLNGKMNKTENGIEQEITMDSNDYNLDFGLLAGTDFMITKNIGSRFSYYYGITKILKEDVTLNINETNLNIMNVGVNAQLLLRF